MEEQESYNKVLDLGKHKAYFYDTYIELVESKKNKKGEEAESIVGTFGYIESLPKRVGEHEALTKILDRIEKHTQKLMKQDFPIEIEDWSITCSDMIYAKRKGMRVNRETGERYETEVETCYYNRTWKETAIRSVLNKIELRKKK